MYAAAPRGSDVNSTACLIPNVVKRWIKDHPGAGEKKYIALALYIS
jgi:hypothetical protein